RILVGQVLRLPVPQPQAPAGDQPGAGGEQTQGQQPQGQGEAPGGGDEPTTPTAEPERPQDRRYTVRAGDNLTRIAEQFQVEGGFQALAEYNNINNPALIQPGQVLRIPPAPTAPT